jgi:hypothetical protein
VFGVEAKSARAGIEALSWKIGLFLLMLGGMHFFNLFIFSMIHRRPKRARGPLNSGSVVEA